MGWEEEGEETAGVGWEGVSASAVWTAGAVSWRAGCAVEGSPWSGLRGLMRLRMKWFCCCGRWMRLDVAGMQTSSPSGTTSVLSLIASSGSTKNRKVQTKAEYTSNEHDDLTGRSAQLLCALVSISAVCGHLSAS